MKQKITAVLFAFLLCLCTAVPALAADAYPRLDDEAGLLSDSEAQALLEKLDEISLRQSVDVVVVTTPDLGGYDTPVEYADDLYDYRGYGYGSSKDGLLLLISMETRDWYISTCGFGITAFTDDGIEYIGEQITPYLSDGDYAGAFDTFADLCDTFITQAYTGEPFDQDNMPRQPLSLIWIPISIGLGIILALIVVGCMKSKLETVRSQAAANSYLKPGSLNITNSSDLFLYHTVTRTEIPKNNDSDGGSSTHTSSSGTTHGGGGGKF